MSKHQINWVVDLAKIIQAIQVCYNFNKENKDREVNGLFEALNKFKLREGHIITFDQEEEFEQKGIKIKIIPVWKWLLSN